MNPLAILKRAFPGHRSPIPHAARWMDVDQSTIYRWIKNPQSMPRYAQLLLRYLDEFGPIMKEKEKS